MRTFVLLAGSSERVAGKHAWKTLGCEGNQRINFTFAILLSMLSDCDPPTFQRRCEKPKKLQGATSQQQTALQPETQGVVETGDVEKQNWYGYHCLNWMEGQRNGERCFEF